MERTFAKVAGAFALALMMVRLTRLIDVGPVLPRWPVILLASVVLGVVAWWLLSQLVGSNRIAVAVFALAGVVLFLRVAVPQALTMGVLPNPSTVPVLTAEVAEALRLIRFGVAPILPSPGVIAVLALVMWTIGALYAAGAISGRSTLMTVPSLVAYVQFAIFDRPQTSTGWMLTSAVVLAMAISAAALERSPDSGQGRDTIGRSIPRRNPSLVLMTAGLVAFAAIATVRTASGAVPEGGNISWRVTGSGYGTDGAGGGVSFNRLVDLRQSIISRTNEVVFRATLSEGSPPADTIYWRVESLDFFDGISWRPGDSSVRRHVPGDPVGTPADGYQGTTVELVQRVQIDALRGELVPTAGTTTDIHRVDDVESGAIRPTDFQITPDASLYYQRRTRAGDIYQVQTVYPLRDADLGALATGPDGELSPVFAGAAEAGLFNHQPSAPPEQVMVPPDLEPFTQLPDELPSGIAQTAARVTRGATTNFERAWMLQHWFRDSGDFTYSTEVTTGHSALVLDEWLNDPESVNHRTGYCEQFAASMAVLGRALGIPSRVVWGFTPGQVVQRDGINVVEVRDTNAHAWVEMWMDGFGWVPFDPTPRSDFLPPSFTEALDPVAFVPDLPPLDPGLGIPPGLLDGLGPLGGPFEFEGLPLQTQRSLWWLLPIGVIGVLGVSVPLTKTVRRRRRLWQIRNGDISAAWEEIVDRLTDLGQEVEPWKTPIEWAGDVNQALMPLASHYSATIYGGRQAVEAESDLATAENWVRTNFDRAKRARASVNPRSLFKRGK